MRARMVIEITLRTVDAGESEMRLVTDDGDRRSTRTMRSGHATIVHAADRLARHYGLVESGPGCWRSADIDGSAGSTPSGRLRTVA